MCLVEEALVALSCWHELPGQLVSISHTDDTGDSVKDILRWGWGERKELGWMDTLAVHKNLLAIGVMDRPSVGICVYKVQTP